MLGVLFGIVFMVLLWTAIIYGFIRLFHHPHKEGSGYTAEDVKRFAVGLAIALLIPVFVNLMLYAVFTDRHDLGSFTAGVVLSLLVLAGGIATQANVVVGGGLLWGSGLSLFFLLAEYYDTFTSPVQMLLAGLGLAGLTMFAYWYNSLPPRAKTKEPRLSGFRAVLLGVTLCTFAVLFANTVNTVINPYPDESMTYTAGAVQQYQQAAFVIILVIGILYLLLGVMIREVLPASAGYIVAGVGLILSAVIASSSDIGAPVLAGLAGVAILALIAFAYWRFGRETPSNLPPPE